MQGDEQEQPKPNEQVRLVEFYMENFMNVKTVAFKPKGRMTVITGGNGQGKTSTLDGIAYVLGGSKWSPAMPGRRGAAKHLVKLGFKGERGSFYFQRTQSGLKFEPAPGCTAWGTPQAMIDSIFNELALDPIGFVHMKPADQVRTLRDYLGLTETLAKLDEDNKRDFDKRRDINRDAERLKTEAAAIAYQEGLPKVKIDEAEIVARSNAAYEENRRLAEKIEHRQKLSERLGDAEQIEARNEKLIEETKTKIENLSRDFAQIEPFPAAAAAIRDALNQTGDQAHRLPGASSLISSIEAAERHAIAYLNDMGARQVQLRGQLDQARLALQAAEAQRPRLAQDVADARAAYNAAPAGELIDTAAIVEELQHAQLVNREIDKRTYREALDAERQAKENEALALSRAMRARDDKKREAIAGAKMPMEGMTFTETEVFFDGVPIAQLGEAKQIEVGIALVLARKPKLRLVRIPHGESLDDKTMAHLAKLAEEQDFYVWMAKVDTSGKVGIYLEDGEIAANNEEEK